MKYTFRGLTVEECFLRSPEFITQCILDPENDADKTVLSKLMTGCAVHADSSDSLPAIKNVYFNPPATVVLWDDGTKTVVKCQDGDTYSKETGLALCMAKKAMGNKSNFNNIFHKWIPEEKTAIVPKGCGTCDFYHTEPWNYPCGSCRNDFSNWKPKK